MAILNRCAPVLILIVLLSKASAQSDGTLKANLSGLNVVTAVLERLDSVSNIFDHLDGNWNIAKVFLRRLAYVETEDGRHYSPGGIWNITVDTLNTTRTYVDSNRLRQRLNDSLQIDWLTVEYTDLSRPLYSGLAAVLVLDEIYGDSELESAQTSNTIFNLHARLWEHFGGGDHDVWNDRVNELLDTHGKFSSPMHA